jgi:DNA-binding transcriptional ArsR family regulator
MACVANSSICLHEHIVNDTIRSEEEMAGPEISDAMIERVARRFRALGEPQRLRILQALENGARTVGEVVTELKGNQPNISRHLQALYDAGLLRRRREGNNIYYSIADPVVHELCALVCDSAHREAAAGLAALRGNGKTKAAVVR